jgi:hypothetical protein
LNGSVEIYFELTSLSSSDHRIVLIISQISTTFIPFLNVNDPVRDANPPFTQSLLSGCPSVCLIVLPSLLPHFSSFTTRDARATNPDMSSPTHCRLRYHQLSTVATRHYNLDHKYSMSTSLKPETFPPEVWLRILDFSTPAVHRAISQLSSAFHHISRRRLYDTIVFGNQVYLGVTRDTAYGATWCRDLKLFYKLHKGRDDWKPYVRGVYVQYCESMVFNDVLCEDRLSAAIW